MKDDIRQFLLQSLKEMNYSTEEIEDDTVLGPAGADLQSLALAELAVRVEDKYGVRFDDEEAETARGHDGRRVHRPGGRPRPGQLGLLSRAARPPSVRQLATGSHRPEGNIVATSMAVTGIGLVSPVGHRRRRGVRRGLRGPLRRRPAGAGPSTARPARRGRLQPRHRPGQRAAGDRGPVRRPRHRDGAAGRRGRPGRRRHRGRPRRGPDPDRGGGLGGGWAGAAGRAGRPVRAPRAGSGSARTCCPACCRTWPRPGSPSSSASRATPPRSARPARPVPSRSVRRCGSCARARPTWCWPAAARHRCSRPSPPPSATPGRWRTAGPTRPTPAARSTGGATAWCWARVPACWCSNAPSTPGPAAPAGTPTCWAGAPPTTPTTRPPRARTARSRPAA